MDSEKQLRTLGPWPLSESVQEKLGRAPELLYDLIQKSPTLKPLCKAYRTLALSLDMQKRKKDESTPAGLGTLQIDTGRFYTGQSCLRFRAESCTMNIRVLESLCHIPTCGMKKESRYQSTLHTDSETPSQR